MGNLNGITGAVITAYRSPSMRAPGIDEFYSALNSLLEDIKKSNNCSFIVFVGDDNASSSSKSYYSKLAASKMNEICEKHQMVDLIPGLCTRGNKQPDSCFAYFDPEEVEVCANLLAGPSATGSDHEAIQVQIKRSQIIAEPPKFKKMKRKKLCVSKSK